MVRGIILSIAIFLGACASTEKVRVETVYVNVPVSAEVPTTIRDYSLPEKPKFVIPTDPNAVVALDRDNAKVLQNQTFSLYRRVCQLESFLGLDNCPENRKEIQP